MASFSLSMQNVVYYFAVCSVYFIPAKLDIHPCYFRAVDVAQCLTDSVLWYIQVCGVCSPAIPRPVRRNIWLDRLHYWQVVFGILWLSAYRPNGAYISQ